MSTTGGLDLPNILSSAKRVVLLNALPLNAISIAVDAKIYPTDTNSVLNALKDLKVPLSCYIGHPATTMLLMKHGINITCTRGNYTYSNGDMLIAFVLKTRPSTSGADVNVVNIDDLLSYVIVLSPLT
jgi:hypothetical protein